MILFIRIKISKSNCNKNHLPNYYQIDKIFFKKNSNHSKYFAKMQKISTILWKDLLEQKNIISSPQKTIFLQKLKFARKGFEFEKKRVGIL